MLVKRLLPLGFTRADIRKELYLSDGNPDQAASKLLAQQEQSERASSSLGDEETDEGGVGEEAQKSGEQEKKPFAIRSVVVSGLVGHVHDIVGNFHGKYLCGFEKLIILVHKNNMIKPRKFLPCENLVDYALKVAFLPEYQGSQ